MVPGMDFLGLPRGDMDRIHWNPYPGIIARNYGKI
jgi:hypothetical protein